MPRSMDGRVDESAYLREPANGALERAFRIRERPRCSKADFAGGFVAALKWLNLYDRYRLDQPEATNQLYQMRARE